MGGGQLRKTPLRFRRPVAPPSSSSAVSSSCLRITTTSSLSENDSDKGNNPIVDPPSSQYIKSYKLTGETGANTNKSGVTVQTTKTGHTLQTDVPRKMGGRDTAPQPVEMLLTAWMGCTQATALFVGRQMQQPHRLLLNRLVFDVQGHRDERGALELPITTDPPVPSRMFRVEGTIIVHRVGGQAITTQEMKVLREQTESRCPVANMMIASGCQMNVEWIDGSTIDG